MRTSHLSLIAMSALFFCLPLLTILNMVQGFIISITGLEFISYMGDFSVPAFISLCGGVAFLLSTREENPRWHLGIPLIIMFAIIAVSPLVEGNLVIRGMNPPIYDPGVLWTLLSQLAFGLLPPCAAFFFWSQKGLGKWRSVFIGIALVITLCSAAMLWAEFSPYLVSAGLIPPEQPYTVNGQPVRSENDGFLILNIMFGLPIIGILFLVLAAATWFATRETDGGDIR
jgi:ribose/xylose/arabinose/galactoside ABC-type transport system permease subunit